MRILIFFFSSIFIASITSVQFILNQVEISEALPPGSFVTPLADRIPLLSEGMSYSVIENEIAVQYFKINNVTFNLHTKQWIDRELLCHTAKCTCEKCILYFNIALSNGSIIAIYILPIVIIDEDDNKPLFQQKSVAFYLEENGHNDALIKLPNAYDADYLDQKLNYSLIFSNEEDSTEFYIREYSLNNLFLVVKNPLDREKKANFTFQLKAQSRKNFAFMTIRLFVSDKNDNAPSCLHESNRFVVGNDWCGVVGHIGVTDIDSDDNAKLNFTLQKSLYSSNFFIDPVEKLLYIQKPASLLKLSGNTIKIKVDINDNGVPALNTTCELHVTFQQTPKAYFKPVNKVIVSNQTIYLPPYLEEGQKVGDIWLQSKNDDNLWMLEVTSNSLRSKQTSKKQYEIYLVKNLTYKLQQFYFSLEIVIWKSAMPTVRSETKFNVIAIPWKYVEIDVPQNNSYIEMNENHTYLSPILTIQTRTLSNVSLENLKYVLVFPRNIELKVNYDGNVYVKSLSTFGQFQVNILVVGNETKYEYCRTCIHLIINERSFLNFKQKHSPLFFHSKTFYFGNFSSLYINDIFVIIVIVIIFLSVAVAVYMTIFRNGSACKKYFHEKFKSGDLCNCDSLETQMDSCSIITDDASKVRNERYASYYLHLNGSPAFIRGECSRANNVKENKLSKIFDTSTSPLRRKVPYSAQIQHRENKSESDLEWKENLISCTSAALNLNSTKVKSGEISKSIFDKLSSSLESKDVFTTNAFVKSSFV